MSADISLNDGAVVHTSNQLHVSETHPETFSIKESLDIPLSKLSEKSCDYNKHHQTFIIEKASDKHTIVGCEHQSQSEEFLATATNLIDDLAVQTGNQLDVSNISLVALDVKERQDAHSKELISEKSSIVIKNYEPLIVEEAKLIEGAPKERPYICNVCHTSFAVKTNLFIHSRVHTGEKNHICSVCQKAFGQKGDLKVHLRIHTGERPYVCKICHKAFGSNSTLSKHSRIHSGRKPYICKLCPKSFSAKSVLNTHLRQHTGEKPYSCDACGKAFSYKRSFSLHVSAHEHRYECNICEKILPNKRMLNSHIKRHATENGFVCNVCEKVLGSKTSLKQHLILHTNSKEYECNICHKIYPIKRHLGRFHDNGMTSVIALKCCSSTEIIIKGALMKQQVKELGTNSVKTRMEILGKK